MTLKPLAAAAVISLGLALACGGGSNSSTSSGAGTSNPPVTLQEHDFAPELSDPAIPKIYTAQNENVFAYLATAGVTRRNQLFLFLPGSTSVPVFYQDILKEAAAKGFHALGLTYENATLVATLVQPYSDPTQPGFDADAAGKVHDAVLQGTTAGNQLPTFTVSAADSLENRLLKALQYLDAQYPSEGWGQYASGGTIQWSLIRLAGHSQGGSEAAYIGTQIALPRVIAFDSPSDAETWVSASTPAAWVQAGHGATPSANYYGFTHQRDPLVPLALAEADWDALVLPGAPTLVDGVSTYGGSHRLYSNLTVTASDPLFLYHDCTVVDAQTPKNSDGTPTYLPVWDALCFE
ncbi:MAG TPA: hypothetical protein VFT46_11315 [Holophagaceae bacterium]|nr:hypothetical protein [Holophagaceae bacterium]